MDDATRFSELMAGLRTGDPVALDSLYREYGPFIRAAVRRQLHPRLRSRFDSLDFVQDVWASFLAVPSDRYAFASPEALVGFLNRVAYRKVIDVFRRRFGTGRDDLTREVPADPTDWGERDQILSAEPTPSQWAVAGEEWQRLLSRFPPGHRAVLERLREGHSYEDIARLANVSVSTVDRVVRRLKDLTGL